MRCEDCIHYDKCSEMYEHIFGNKYENEVENICNTFKDKSLFVELPCKMNDTIYCVGSKCLSGLYDKECEYFGQDECPCRLNEELIIFKRIVSKSLLIALIFEDNENFIFGETVFLSREEAETRLKELQEKKQ